MWLTKVLVLVTIKVYFPMLMKDLLRSGSVVTCQVTSRAPAEFRSINNQTVQAGRRRHRRRCRRAEGC